jgi:rhamnosyltransferase
VSGRAPRIAAVVVLYHPGPEVVDNIRTWAGQVETVYAVDNSEKQGPGAGDRGLKNATYLPQGENVGIARALNIGATRAFAAGYDLLLTMDQDSRAEANMVAKLLECRSAEGGSAVGIVAPFHMTRAVRRPPPDVACSEVMTPMTSGCLLDLAVWQTVGPFRDDFFIDFVDNEYCLRLRREGYRVLRANRAILEHAVGDITRYGPIIATNHSPLRRYYKTRNRFVVFHEYLTTFPGHCLFDLVRLAKEIGSIVLFEDEKWAKLRMMWRGWRDCQSGKMGKLIV